jgi:hypothetical protein
MLRLNGSVTITPLGGRLLGPSSGVPSTEVPFDEPVALSAYMVQSLVLDTDSPMSVPFGGVSSVNFLSVKAIDGKVRVRLTSADGSAQAVPVDGLLVVQTDSVPITSIDVMRVAGTQTSVEVILGQKV